MEAKKQISPDEVANSAESQLLNLKKAGDAKQKEVSDERKRILEFKKMVSCLIYATASTYKNVYPGAKGFVEGRVKSPNSIETKIINEITEKLNQIKEDPNINQEEIIKKILEIDFKDILALSVITTVPPKKFRTGSDEVNKKLNSMSENLQITTKRLEEHSSFISTNDERATVLSNQLYELKKKMQSASSKQEKIELVKEQEQRLLQIYQNQELTPEEFMEQIKILTKLIVSLEKEDLQKVIEEKSAELELVMENMEYGKRNEDRTQDVYDSTLRNLQYQMSLYYVSNLEKFSTFKYWGTEAIRVPKQIEKNGFRAVNTGYSVAFSDLDEKDKKYTMKFEAQGKGKMDYDEAEFSWLGASYHEEQKTKDGIISKRTEDLDFTIIGRELTEKIEKRVRRQYTDISSIYDLEEYIEENPEDLEVQTLYTQLMSYEQELKNQGADKKDIKRKIKEVFSSSKELLIQTKIESIIDEIIGNIADGDNFLQKIEENEELKSFFEDEKGKIAEKEADLSEDEIDHRARVRTLYRIKEREVQNVASKSVPPFFRTNIDNNEPIVYWFSMGESIYRYYYNRLNGLKDENGIYKYKPQEQQKRALLKLSGLFEIEDGAFYTYNDITESFGGLSSKGFDIEL